MLCLFEPLGQDFRVGRRPEAADVRGSGVGGGQTFWTCLCHACAMFVAFKEINFDGPQHVFFVGCFSLDRLGLPASEYHEILNAHREKKHVQNFIV
jgi:hypothetical protein